MSRLMLLAEKKSLNVAIVTGKKISAAAAAFLEKVCV